MLVDFTGETLSRCIDYSWQESRKSFRCVCNIRRGCDIHEADGEVASPENFRIQVAIVLEHIRRTGKHPSMTWIDLAL